MRSIRLHSEPCSKNSGLDPLFAGVRLFAELNGFPAASAQKGTVPAPVLSRKHPVVVSPNKTPQKNEGGAIGIRNPGTFAAEFPRLVSIGRRPASGWPT